MPFKLNIKNIGNLENADVSIDRFTVLAGPNNSGIIPNPNQKLVRFNEIL